MLWAWLKKWLNPFNWFKTEPDKAVAAVIRAVEMMCGFVPTVTSVTAMLGAPNPAVVGVGAVALAICRVMTARKSGTMAMARAAGSPSKSLPPPYVNGVPVEGKWK